MQKSDRATDSFAWIYESGNRTLVPQGGTPLDMKIFLGLELLENHF